MTTDCDRLLRRLGACQEARDWARGKTLKQAWATCQRADWMLWLAGSLSGPDGDPRRRSLVRCAAECAEWSAKYADDETAGVVLHVSQVCYAWADGNASDNDLGASAARAWAAAGGELSDIVRLHYPTPPTGGVR